MKLRFSLLAGLFVCLPILSYTAFAGSIPVANFSFEMAPAFNVFCGGTCEYTVGLPVPDWNTTGATGQWITGGYAGNPPAFDGSVLAYSNGGTLSQDVGTVTVGPTYTLQVEILHRTDLPMTGIAQLEIGGVVVATATGTDMGPGTWSDWTATYTPIAADAGKTLTILLTSSGEQGDWDNVRLTSSGSTAVPEPAGMLLLGSGLVTVALAVRRRRSR